jgi:hypothetical protein
MRKGVWDWTLATESWGYFRRTMSRTAASSRDASDRLTTPHVMGPRAEGRGGRRPEPPLQEALGKHQVTEPALPLYPALS